MKIWPGKDWGRFMVSRERAVIFDLNDVLVLDGWRIAYTKLAEKLGCESVEEMWEGPLRGWQEHWKEAYRGEKDEEEIYLLIASAFKEPQKTLVMKAFHGYEKESALNREVLEIARELKSAGYKLGILANSTPSWYQRWHAFLEKSEIFDVILVSSEIGAIKPEKKAFRAVIESFRVNPGDCVFIDDRQANIEAAEKFGMEGILFTNAANLRAVLQKKKILPPEKDEI